MPRSLLQILRVTHLYVGVFIAPALLFFAFTGAIQSFGLHETNRDHPNYKPAHWIEVLAHIHKKQNVVVPVRKPLPQAPDAPASHPVPPAPAAPTPPPRNPNPVPLRVFFVVVCVGLFTSTVTGVYMAYKYNRNRRLVTLTLAAGIILPLLLLLF